MNSREPVRGARTRADRVLKLQSTSIPLHPTTFLTTPTNRIVLFGFVSLPQAILHDSQAATCWSATPLRTLASCNGSCGRQIRPLGPDARTYGTLITFELDRLPHNRGVFQTRRLSDHRLTYLDYEGHISGNRGQVVRLDRGLYHELHVQEAHDSERRFQYELKGARLTAVLACDQPLFLVPFARPVELEALQWDWHD